MQSSSTQRSCGSARHNAARTCQRNRHGENTLGRCARRRGHQPETACAVYRAADLVRQLLEARDTREPTGLQQRLLRVDVLSVDELGFVPFDRAGGERLFYLITDRYERRATVVNTNLAVAEWVTVVTGDGQSRPPLTC